MTATAQTASDDAGVIQVNVMLFLNLAVVALKLAAQTASAPFSRLVQIVFFF